MYIHAPYIRTVYVVRARAACLACCDALELPVTALDVLCYLSMLFVLESCPSIHGGWMRGLVRYICSQVFVPRFCKGAVSSVLSCRAEEYMHFLFMLYTRNNGGVLCATGARNRYRYRVGS